MISSSPSYSVVLITSVLRNIFTVLRAFFGYKFESLTAKISTRAFSIGIDPTWTSRHVRFVTNINKPWVIFCEHNPNFLVRELSFFVPDSSRKKKNMWATEKKKKKMKDRFFEDEFIRPRYLRFQDVYIRPWHSKTDHTGKRKTTSKNNALNSSDSSGKWIRRVVAEGRELTPQYKFWKCWRKPLNYRLSIAPVRECAKPEVRFELMRYLRILITDDLPAELQGQTLAGYR